MRVMVVSLSVPSGTTATRCTADDDPEIDDELNKAINSENGAVSAIVTKGRCLIRSVRR